MGQSGEEWGLLTRFPFQARICPTPGRLILTQLPPKQKGKRSLMAFRGTYDHTVDDRGRVAIPARYRHEFVAQAVLNGIVQVSLETEVPVLSAVLTPQQFHEHEAHVQFFRDHMLVKGRELAEACTSIVDTVAALPVR